MLSESNINAPLHIIIGASTGNTRGTATMSFGSGYNYVNVTKNVCVGRYNSFGLGADGQMATKIIPLCSKGNNMWFWQMFSGSSG